MNNLKRPLLRGGLFYLKAGYRIFQGLKTSTTRSGYDEGKQII